jgi:hypothetical protein
VHVRGAEAELPGARPQNDFIVPILLRQRFHDGLGAVGGRVVDDDDLKVEIAGGEREGRLSGGAGARAPIAGPDAASGARRRSPLHQRDRSQGRRGRRTAPAAVAPSPTRNKSAPCPSLLYTHAASSSRTSSHTTRATLSRSL